LKQRANIRVTGVVQGVGFRPFVFRLAKNSHLVGYVLNSGNAGVRIVLEGDRGHIERLIDQVMKKAPSVSRIDTINVEWTDATGEFTDFLIEKSLDVKEDTAAVDIPPDIAICQDCIDDVFNPKSRWLLYPFTSCSACGPRFSTITDVPYDRRNTTMNDFPLCSTCNTGYKSPSDRRYHAQTTACPHCGPSYRLLDTSGRPLEVSKPIAYAAQMLESGGIVAVQGISGTHLVTITSKPDPILNLRERKKRFSRPFAIMVRNLETLSELFLASSAEIDLMSSWRRPVVLVRKTDGWGTTKRHDSLLPRKIPAKCLDLISPGLDTVGVMLPYSGLHHVLFHHLEEPALIMTSANPSGVPMYIEPGVLVSELKGIADFFLVHNRKIEQRADDSVMKLVGSGPVFVRRSRGYVPEPIIVGGVRNGIRAVALGPEEKATGAVLTSGKIYQTQHIGDTDRIENEDFLWDALNHLMHVLAVSNFDAVACDLNPEFLSTELAGRIAIEHGVPLIHVQHHHAHLASLIADSGLPIDTGIVCITMDGYGYAPNGDAWGGDVLLGNGAKAIRVGGLKSQVYVGGDLSAKYSLRALLGILGDAVEGAHVISLIGKADIAPGLAATSDNLSILADIRRHGSNVIRSTSAGRFLDAVTAALGICFENSYDGECPMRLEAVARQTGLRIHGEHDYRDSLVLDTTPVLQEVVRLREEGVPVEEIAYAAQWYLGESLASVACTVSREKGLNSVGISGGVAVNRIIMEAATKLIEREGLRLLVHRNVPPGDGGVSAGQVVVAASIIA
jgi:hydrogenase maturation protein HypF